MKYITNFSNTIGRMLSIDGDYIFLIILSIFVLVFFKIIAKLIVFIYVKFERDTKQLFIVNKRVNMICEIISIIVIFLLWDNYLTNIITIISFVSAGVAIAIRDIIINLFAGVYIKTKKPFKIEDRIEINGMKGDVVVINNLSFSILEVGDRINSEQSSGIVINIPNSFVITYALKNYSTAFKYIWDEITVKLPLNADVEKTKKELLKIVNSNEVIKTIPKKMDQAIEDASLEYRIYYNHLEPIIYTSVVDSHIELYIRFLVHPKKIRNVEDDIWLRILNKNNENKITLYSETTL